MSKLRLPGKDSRKQVRSDEEQYKKSSQFREVMGRLARNKVAMACAVVILLLILVAIFAEYIAPYGYDEIDPRARFAFPCLAHPFGTDNFGRDLLSRIIYGTRVSLGIAVLSCGIALLIALVLGCSAGYFGGVVDTIIMRVMDMMMAIPTFLLAVAISSALGSGTLNTALAMAVGSTPGYTRLIRASVMTIRDQEFVEAARASGASQFRIITKQVLPNTLSPILVNVTLSMGGAIMNIAGLSFIGLGVQAPIAEWGAILSSGRAYIQTFWPLVVFPGIAIMITMLAFNMLGDGLRDAMDPRLKR